MSFNNFQAPKSIEQLCAEYSAQNPTRFILRMNIGLPKEGRTTKAGTASKKLVSCSSGGFFPGGSGVFLKARPWDIAVFNNETGWDLPPARTSNGYGFAPGQNPSGLYALMAGVMEKAKAAAGSSATVGLDEVWDEEMKFTFADREVFERDIMRHLRDGGDRVLTNSVVFAAGIRLIVGSDGGLIWAISEVQILGLADMVTMKQGGLVLGQADYVAAYEKYAAADVKVDPLLAIGQAIMASEKEGQKPSRSQRRKAAYAASQSPAQPSTPSLANLANDGVKNDDKKLAFDLGELDIM